MFSALIIFLLVLIALKFAFSTWLEALNMGCVKEHSSEVPEAFRAFMDAGTYKKGVAYTLEKTKFGVAEDAWSSLVLAAVLVSGLLPGMFDLGIKIFGNSVWAQALTMLLMGVVFSIFSLPFELWSQFVIEEKFGFNKGSFGLWVADKLKELAVSFVLGIPILALLIWLFETIGDGWWIWGFAAFAAFQILMIIIYPRFIMPLFNKLEPLPDGELKTSLFNLADRGGFAARTILVMDGSKRSSHSNAFFTGFGKFRKIVLFDTLLQQLNPNELEAVLAHEIGHYKKGHIVKMILFSLFEMFAIFAVMGLLSKSAWFYESFGFRADSGFVPILFMVSICAGLFGFWLTPLSNALSRRYEYQADAFAAKLCSAKSLSEALRKLHKKNLGNLTPHKLYSAFHYSHPTLLEREEAMFESEKQK